MLYKKSVLQTILDFLCYTLAIASFAVRETAGIPHLPWWEKDQVFRAC